MDQSIFSEGRNKGEKERAGHPIIYLRGVEGDELAGEGYPSIYLRGVERGCKFVGTKRSSSGLEGWLGAAEARWWATVQGSAVSRGRWRQAVRPVLDR